MSIYRKPWTAAEDAFLFEWSVPGVRAVAVAGRTPAACSKRLNHLRHADALVQDMMDTAALFGIGGDSPPEAAVDEKKRAPSPPAARTHEQLPPRAHTLGRKIARIDGLFERSGSGFEAINAMLARQRDARKEGWDGLPVGM